MIMILQELMLKLFVEMHGRAPKLEEIPRPCDHFDLIGGTGTGGYVFALIEILVRVGVSITNLFMGPLGLLLS